MAPLTQREGWRFQPEAPPWSHVFCHILHALWGSGHSERRRGGPWPLRHWPCLFRGFSTPTSHHPELLAQVRGSAGLGRARQFLSAEILLWPFPSIVCCPSDLLKPCVSYRFCLPALTSLFCSSKQPFSIYRSLHLTKRNLGPWTGWLH